MIVFKELNFLFSFFPRVVCQGETEKEGKMDIKNAGSSLDSLVSSFNTRISEIQQLVVARNSKFAQLFVLKLFKGNYS